MNDPTPLTTVLLRPQDEGRPALFSSQSELAKQLAAAPGSPYSKKLISLRSYLQQILAGNRRCSKSLGDLLISVVNNSHGEPDARRVEAAIAEHNREIGHRRREHESARADPLSAIEEAQSKASRVHIFTTDPIEVLPTGSPTRTVLVGETIDALLAKEDPSYVYCVPDEQTAEAVWQGLFRHALKEKELAPDTVDEAFCDCDQEDRLVVYETELLYCLYPTVVYDVHLNEAQAFIWFGAWGEDKPIQLPESFLRNVWLRHCFKPIDDEDPKAIRRRIRWSDVRKKLYQRPE